MKKLLFFLLLISGTGVMAQSAERTPDCLDSLNIPTSFSPNSDGLHDVFQIYFPCAPEQFEITIFNRWGEEIFKSDQHTFTWNGSYKDRMVEMDTYFYVLKYTYLGKDINKTGNFTVLI